VLETMHMMNIFKKILQSLISSWCTTIVGILVQKLPVTISHFPLYFIYSSSYSQALVRSLTLAPFNELTVTMFNPRVLRRFTNILNQTMHMIIFEELTSSSSKVQNSTSGT
jgi:hypothetical protein